ncbi:hypothetical protein ROZALSC1DRAFT_30465, partial [Rozella allomycis CSF55]
IDLIKNKKSVELVEKYIQFLCKGLEIEDRKEEIERILVEEIENNIEEGFHSELIFTLWFNYNKESLERVIAMSNHAVGCFPQSKALWMTRISLITSQLSSLMDSVDENVLVQVRMIIQKAVECLSAEDVNECLSSYVAFIYASQLPIEITLNEFEYICSIQCSGMKDIFAFMLSSLSDIQIVRQFYSRILNNQKYFLLPVIIQFELMQENVDYLIVKKLFEKSIIFDPNSDGKINHLL